MKRRRPERKKEPEEKRRPTLADRFVTHNYTSADQYLAPGLLEDLQRKARLAHRFTFDEGAATRVGNVVRDIPELLAREHLFACPPYDLTWIEYPYPPYWLAVGNDPRYQDETTDLDIGYLIDHNVVTVVCGGTVSRPRMTPYPTVLQYHLNTEWPPDMQEAFARMGDISLDVLDQHLWGSTYYKLDPETRTLLRQHNAVVPTPCAKTKLSEDMRRRLDVAFSGSAGELRTIIAMLLMLNRPTITRYSNVQAGRGWIKNKFAPFLSHTTVTIDLDAVPTLRLVGTPEGDAVPRRWHEVRGHYCHDRASRDYHRIAGCIHDYQPTYRDWEPWPNAPLGLPGQPGCARNWVCSHCGGKRWWLPKHGRGDASVGVVVHDEYRVTGRFSA